MITINFTLAGAPRTKKTSNRIVKVGKFTKILPSAAHEAWFHEMLPKAAKIRLKLSAQRPGLFPLTCDVNVRALFYRDARTGDAVGYYQSLADLLQAPKTSRKGRLLRTGAGLVKDDSQIVSWDGSRLFVDGARPRIEVEITSLEAAQQHFLESVAGR